MPYHVYALKHSLKWTIRENLAMTGGRFLPLFGIRIYTKPKRWPTFSHNCIYTRFLIVFARFIIRAPPRSGRRPIVIVLVIYFSFTVSAEMVSRRDMVPTPFDAECSDLVRKFVWFRKFSFGRKLWRHFYFFCRIPCYNWANENFLLSMISQSW